MHLTGKKVGHIRVDRIIGHGGMGAVYEGFDEKLARRVALKVIRTDRLGDIGRSRLVREAQALSQLDHPHICRIYDCLEDAEGDILVLELIQGRTLTRAIQDGLSRSEKLRIASAIAGALIAAHRAGIIHRDLKPENVMLTSAGDVKVLDFGLARWVIANDEAAGLVQPVIETAPVAAAASPVDGDGMETAVLPGRIAVVRGSPELETALGAAVGTPVYMSPEQARGETLTTASDMFSFGLLLQVLFGGDAPYDTHSTVREIIEKAARAESSPPRGLDRDVRLLVQRLKSVAPSDRPTAAEGARRLQIIIEKPKRIARRAAAAILTLVAIAGVWKYTVDLRRERAGAIAAEAEARLRRADADALIGFMLGDLRKKLEPVGKLDVLDDVAARSLKVLSSIDHNRMTADELQRTATALDQLGEVRISQGKLNDATQAFDRARVIAAEAMKRAPDDAEAQLTYATSHFWIGNALRLRGDLSAALGHMIIYKDVAAKLASRYPGNDKYRTESAYGFSTVGTIFEAQGQLEKALENYRMTRAIKAERARAVPSDLDRQGDLAVTLDKIGVVLQRVGDLAGARRSFEDEEAILMRLTTTQPENMVWKRRLGVAYSYLALTYENAGDVDNAVSIARKQLELFAAVAARDPANVDRMRDLAVTHDKLGRLLRFQNHTDQSLLELRLAAEMLQPIVAKEPQRKEWQRDLGRIHLSRARTLLALRRNAEAIASVAMAESEFQRSPSDVATRRAFAEVLIVKGDSQADANVARAQWTRAAELLRKDIAVNAEPSTLALYAAALIRAGSNSSEVRGILDRLEHMGYHHPDLSPPRHISTAA
jgi:tRNA A-37 threonylcarbamoyl transferase component Bud32/tetratricopeptide (TPR) repeat protein